MKNVRSSKFKMPQAQDHSSGTSGEGGLVELCLFAIFFVLVFSAIARAKTPVIGSEPIERAPTPVVASFE